MPGKYDKLVLKAVAICFKPFLKPEEAMIYTNLAHSQFAKRCSEFGIYKNNSGYFKRDDLDRMMSGIPSEIEEKSRQVKMRFR